MTIYTFHNEQSSFKRTYALRDQAGQLLYHVKKASAWTSRYLIYGPNQEVVGTLEQKTRFLTSYLEVSLTDQPPVKLVFKGNKIIAEQTDLTISLKNSGRQVKVEESGRLVLTSQFKPKLLKSYDQLELAADVPILRGLVLMMAVQLKREMAQTAILLTTLN